MASYTLLYFDHNASTPVAPEVAETYSAALQDVYGNASSTHRQGQIARERLEYSRKVVADFVGASPAELVFTSGGTESNNLAILGLVRNLPGFKKHVITAALEHPSVLEPFRQLEREGVEVTVIGVNSNGVVDADDIARNLHPETVLVSIAHANNEVGTVHPIAEISAILRQRRDAGQRIFFHSDGVQALGKLSIDVRHLGVDLYSFSAHKIYGPKGIGGLFVRKNTPLGHVQFGGRHERDRRAGTENVPAALAFAKAVQLCDGNLPASALRDRFEDAVLERIEEVSINGEREKRLPNTSNLLFHGVSAEALVIALDMRGIAVSTGSACSSGSVEPSHVLLAMGLSREDARSSVRFSLGRYNTAEDLEALIDAVVSSVAKLRSSRSMERRVAV